MSSIPSHLGRVPSLLTTQVITSNLNRTNRSLLQVQLELSSGLRLHRPSDDPAGATLVQALQNSMATREQRQRNLSHADGLMSIQDHAMEEMTGIVLDARDIASEMIGIGGDTETRRQQAEVISAMIREMVELGNTKSGRVHLFGGNATENAPIQGLLGGYRYAGSRDSWRLDLGAGESIDVTMGANAAFGALSTRVEGDRDLDAQLTLGTKIGVLNGARGLGVELGTMNIDVPGVGTTTVDLTAANSVGDVIDLIDDAIAQLETDTGTPILGPGRVSIGSTGDEIGLDVLAGVSVDFVDIGAQRVAADLGLDGGVFTNGAPDGLDLDARMTPLTRLSDLPGLGTLDDFVIKNGGQTRTISLTGVVTIQDLSNAVNRAGIGVRLEIDATGKRLNMVNELSGSGPMSIEETVGGSTATMLGIRSFTGSTRLSDFNDGLGVSIRSGSIDPNTGDPDPVLDVDFTIVLSDATEFDVDLAGAETVQDVIDMITAAAPPGSLTVGVTDGANGLTLTDLTGGAGQFAVVAKNGSSAAEDLGIQVEAVGAILTGEDRATIAVDSVLTHLSALRDALLEDDSAGITLAGERLSADHDRLSQARGVLGQRMNRVSAISNREEDRELLDQSLMSQIRDLDYNEASVRFSSLRTQLEASMIVGSQVGNLSLMRFLG